jgi:hypothetical protein
MRDEDVYAQPRAHGGEVDAALHAVRQHFDEGGFLDSLRGMFSGPDVMSTGNAPTPGNWGDPELASDFFKADKAMRLAQQAAPEHEVPQPLRRPVEVEPRQQIAAAPPAPAPAPERPPITITSAPLIGPYDFGRSVTEHQIGRGSPVHLTEHPGFGQSLNLQDMPRADTAPEIGSRELHNYTLPEAALASPAPQAEVNRAVSLARETIPSFEQALANVEKLHNAGIYSGPELDKAGEILGAHLRARDAGIPVEEALRLSRAEGPMLVNQGMPAPAPIPARFLAYSPEAPAAPAAAAIDKLTARAPQGPDLNDRQRDLIIRTIAAETSGKSPEESQAIAHVILNRIQSGKYGATPEAVLFARKQFEPWSNPNGANYPMRFTPESRRYGLGQTALDAALGSEDITKGATNFWAPKAQAALGRRPPKWGRTGGVDIGETRFHNLSRAHGGLVDDALHVVREHHADGEAVGQAPEMPAEEPRPLTIYRDNAPVADEAGGSGREPTPAPPAFSYMPIPESVARQAARQPAPETKWPHEAMTEGERLISNLGVEDLPKGETFMSPQPSGWEKYMPQRVPGTFLKRTGEAFNENADAVSEGLKAVRQGNYGAGALGMLGGAFGAAISPVTGMERVLVRDPYLRMTGNLKDAQAAEMVADAALTGGMRGPAKQLLGRGVEGMATDQLSKIRMPSPGAAGAATAAGAMLAPEDAEASKLSKAMEVARMAIPRELSPLGFYSHGAEAARGLAQAKGTPEQFAAMLQKSGVKGPEMEGFLKTFGGRPIVTQEEVAQHFQDTMPQIEERVLRDRKFRDVNEAQAAVDAALERGDPAAAELLHRDWEAQFQGNTKFGQYTLPGGENYREVLLKLPDEFGALRKEVAEAKSLRTQAVDDYAKAAPGSPEASEAQDRIIKYTRLHNGLIDKKTNMPDFRSSHWDDPNVLAHLRMADRTGPNGEKILHVEEIQSDWGQKGKKEGFKGQYTELPPDRNVIESVNARGEPIFHIEGPGEMTETARHYSRESAVNSWLNDRGGVPPAPYVTNTQAWTDLALKRALREAAEGGYDKLVWTPGAEQAKRYDLSKQISNLEYVPGDNHLKAYDTSGRQVMNQMGVPPEKISDYVGKDVAAKLLNDENAVKFNGETGFHRLSGLDLQTGGEGMKGYYDKIVPNQLSKLVKKLDPEAKIEMGRMPVQNHTISAPDIARELGMSVEAVAALPHDEKMALINTVRHSIAAPSLTITPKMREAIMKGQTAFKDGGSVVDRALMLVSRQA